jgi:hypothetical protein
MKKIFFASLLALFTINSCGLFHKDYRIIAYDKMPNTKNHNTCKMLIDSVVVYAIFVDVDIYHPWTEFDIQSTVDSINKSVKWLESQAKKQSVSLSIKTVPHQQGSRRTIYEKSAKTSLSLYGIQAVNNRSMKKLKPWAEAISKYTGKGINYKPSTSIHQRLKIVNTQTLNLALRDKFKCENVAIMFFVNGYYEDHPSISFNTNTLDQKVEYSIITNKNPAVIAHELMHLFGAVDLYPNFNFPNFNFLELKEKHPNEIMLVQHKEINKLNVSPISSYFLGWQDTLDKSNTRLLFHKLNVLDY